MLKLSRQAFLAGGIMDYGNGRAGVIDVGAVDWERYALPIFEGLEQNSIEMFFQAIGASVQNHEKGSRILRAYDENPYVCILVEGNAQVISEDRFGNEAVGHYLERGSLFGCPAAVLGEEYNCISIDATTDVMVLRIPYKNLLTKGIHLGKIHGIVMQNFLKILSRKMVLMMRKIEVLSQKTVRERLTVYLLHEEETQHAERVCIPGRVQLAKYLECNRSALTREISHMKEE